LDSGNVASTKRIDHKPLGASCGSADAGAGWTNVERRG
jgi:hypothetical protein